MARDLVWTPEIVPNGGIDESRSPTQIADNKWAAASNVEPLRDGCRMRRGRSQANAAAIQAIDQESDSGTDSREFSVGTAIYIGQGFQLSADATIDQVAVRLKVVGTLSAGDIEAGLYNDSGSGDPGTNQNGFYFSQSSDVADSDVGTEYSWYIFTSSVGLALTASTQYYLVIKYTDAAATGTNNIFIEEHTTGNPYTTGGANSCVHYSTDNLFWTGVANADLNFRIYNGDAIITGIKDYELADGSAQYHLVMADKELYKKTGVTGSAVMTPVSGREREGMTGGGNVFPSMTVGQDRCLIAPGTPDIGKKFYELNGMEYWENESIAAPTATPTLSTVAGGSLTSGEQYSVDYMYWNDDLNLPSGFRYQGLSTPNATPSGGNLTIRVSNLPATTARENDRATHIRIYLRNDTQNDPVFTYSGTQVALGTTTADVTNHGQGIEAVYDHLLAPVHTIKQVAENRQFIAGITDYPYRLQWSLIEGINAFYESFATNSFRDFGKGDADRITALAYIPPRTLVVGMKNSIRAIDARRPGTSDVATISNEIGIAHHLAYTVVGRRMYFVSDAHRQKGMYTWAGSGEPQLVSGVDDTFKLFNQGRLRYASCAHLASGDERFQWWTLLSSGSTPDTVLMYDYVLGAWAKYPYTGNVLGEFEESSVNKIFIGGRDGFERECDLGADDDGTAITTSLELKAYDFGSQEQLKKLRWFDYVAEQKTTGSLGLQVKSDFGARESFSANLEYAGTGDAFILGTSSWGGGAILGGGTGNVAKRVALLGIGKFIQPTFSSTDDWFLKSLAMGVQPLGRRFS